MMKRLIQTHNKIRYYFWLPFLLLCFLLLPTGVWADSDGGYIVTLKDNADVSTAFEQSYDLTQLTKKDHGIYETDAANAAKLEGNPLVESVIKAGSRTLMVTANDDPNVMNKQWALGAVNAAGGWDVTTGSNSVTVVVIDTGFTYSHEDKGNVTAGKDYITGTTNTYDCDTHGTATAGLIGAATNNGLGISAACWKVNVVMLRVFYNDEELDSDVDTRIIAAVYDAVDFYHADVISMSFGGEKTYPDYKKAFQYAYDKGAILVAAAGNSRTNGSHTEYPAGYDEVISVAAVNSSLVTDYYSTANDSVYVAAPGSDILSLANPNYAINGIYYQYYPHFNGTSLATPYVAGLAALARSIDPDITTEQFKYYLRNYSRDIETAGYDINSGYGLIDYSAVLNAIKSDRSMPAPTGNGTTDSPYLIADEDDLRWLAVTAAGVDNTISAQLTADITVSAANWRPIEGFNGSFDGNGHTVTLAPGNSGLFDVVDTGAAIKNLTVSAALSGGDEAGLIAKENKGTISGCITKGSVSAAYAGGVCAVNNGSILGCANTATVNGVNYGGGITAVNDGGQISYSYNTGAVTAANNNTGGICAYIKSGATLSSCYNTGKVAGSATSRGIVTRNSQSTVGYCFYDSNEITNGSSSATICGKTTDFMKTGGFICLLNQGRGYFNIDTDNVNNGYPVLSGTALTTSFGDVPINEWYTDSVYNLAAKGILLGKSANTFSPGDTVTRAEFTTILARAAGADLSAYSGQSSFGDVASNQWYTAAIAWAYKNNLVEGVGNNMFSPNSQISRQEIAVITTRFIKKITGETLTPTAEPAFHDNAAIAVWAKESVAIMTDHSFILGFPDGSFHPTENATRAQAAIIVTRVLNWLD